MGNVEIFQAQERIERNKEWKRRREEAEQMGGGKDGRSKVAELQNVTDIADVQKPLRVWGKIFENEKVCKESHILQLCKVEVGGNGGGRGKDNVAPLSSLSGGRHFL